MKTQKILEKLDNQLDSAARCQQDREKKLEAFRMQLKIEEQKLINVLKKVKESSMRSEIEKQLGLVKQGYALLA